MVSAPFHGLLHLGAETAVGKRQRFPRDGLPIEPGGARRRNLPLNVEIGADGERDAAFTAGVIEFA